MSENPLLIAPRTATVEIYSGDVEAKLADLLARTNAAIAEDNDGRPKRNTYKSKALPLAEEHDALIESERENCIKVVLNQLRPLRRFHELQDAHPLREGNKRDKVFAVNVDTFFPALIRESMVSPEVTDEQYAEFVETCPPAAWIRLSNVAYELTTGDVTLPKFSAVSALQRMRDSDSTPQPDSE